jgi:hypothetical protein
MSHSGDLTHGCATTYNSHYHEKSWYFSKQSNAKLSVYSNFRESVITRPNRDVLVGGAARDDAAASLLTPPHAPPPC